MPASILWIAVGTGVVVLGGAHLALWLFVRAQRKAESERSEG